MGGVGKSRLSFPIVLTCIWLLIIIREPWPLPPGVALIAGLTVALLPLSGANGLLFTPFAALWLAAGTFIYRQGVTAKWVAPFQSACSMLSIGLGGLYFVGYVRPFKGAQNGGIGSIALAAVRYVGMAIGPVGAGKVPPKWITGGLFSGITSFLLASSIIPLRNGLHCFPKSERFRIFGLLLFGTAMAA